MLGEATVSRFHCVVEASEEGARVRDAQSTNGTFVDGVRVEDGWLKDGSVLSVGRVRLRFAWGATAMRVSLSARSRLGSLVGVSAAMREAFAALERCARAESTVLLTGETGTGKEGAAEAVHELSARSDKPLVVIDCGAIQAGLLESQLFGHEVGAFTGASARHIGAFERADGGTVFLDEVGELPPDLQPKLLRVLEEGSYRRLGGTERRQTDVRVIAATRRPLEREVNTGAFRSDLFYRLAVLQVHMPPLRQRLEDLPVLVADLLERLDAPPDARERILSPVFQRRLRGSSWPGNVRELRNVVQRALVLELDPDISVSSSDELPVDIRLEWTDARQRAIEHFERRYLVALLASEGDNVSQAARRAGVDRVYLHRLLRRHGLR